ncbi:MAG: crossover junction endodeoxyribonuclease RuvC [candidate division WOR-3 bacterium]
MKITQNIPRILGLDPGLSATGFGIVINNHCLECGIIRSNSKQMLAERIYHIVQNLRKKIRQYQPTTCVIETLFFRKESARSVIYSAHLRGAIFFLCHQEKIPVIEVTPATVKRSLTGNGRASKQQINYVVKKIFNIKEKINEHVSDALAIAYTFQTIKHTKPFIAH